MRTGIETGAERQFGKRAPPGFRRYKQRPAELQPSIQDKLLQGLVVGLKSLVQIARRTSHFTGDGFDVQIGVMSEAFDLASADRRSCYNRTAQREMLAYWV